MPRLPRIPQFAPKSATFYPDTKDPKECIKEEKARILLQEYTDEYRMLATERDNPAALTRRTEISRELKKLSDFLLIREPIVKVTLPRDMKEPIRINDRLFLPGEYELPVSVAATILYMESQRRRQERALMTNNGSEKDLGTVGSASAVTA